jgi:hypothetical protein
MQGYHFSPPLPVPELEVLLSEASGAGTARKALTVQAF